MSNRSLSRDQTLHFNGMLRTRSNHGWTAFLVSSTSKTLTNKAKHASSPNVTVSSDRSGFTFGCSGTVTPTSKEPLRIISELAKAFTGYLAASGVEKLQDGPSSSWFVEL